MFQSYYYFLYFYSMTDNELADHIESTTLMLEAIKEQIPFNTQNVTNKALVNVTTFINNVVVHNEGKQLLLFEDSDKVV